MQSLCVAWVTVGAMIMGYSILAYNRILKNMQMQIYDRVIFQHWIYRVVMVMMVFFFVGYVFVGVGFALTPYQPVNCLIALIFFFGAVFVFCMVQVQHRMTATIIDKSAQTIQAMINAMEAKDIYTKGHSEHVRNLSLLIYKHLPDPLKSRVNPSKLADAAMLHDIGKIGIPDYILNKPGRLTPEEYEIVKTHPQRGKAILESTCYGDLADWILYHHEKMDGTGYYGLAGDQVPLEARIISLADICSAMYTDRVYREKFSFEAVIEEIQKIAGTALDPDLVSLFCGIDHEEIDQASVFFTETP